MIDVVLKNRWTTAVNLYNNNDLNTVGASVSTIERMLRDVHLDAYRPVIAPLITEENK